MREWKASKARIFISYSTEMVLSGGGGGGSWKPAAIVHYTAILVTCFIIKGMLCEKQQTSKLNVKYTPR